jgi:hypothetical protein
LWELPKKRPRPVIGTMKRSADLPHGDSKHHAEQVNTWRRKIFPEGQKIGIKGTSIGWPQPGANTLPAPL